MGGRYVTENGDEPPAHVLPLCETFEEDIRRYVIADLPHKAAHTSELEAMPMRALMEIYVNWTHRFIRPRPRRIHLSKAL